MKKLAMTIAVALVMGIGISASAQTKDTININRNRIELKEEGKKHYFELTMQDGKTRKVSTDKKSAENYLAGGKPYLVINVTEFERKISKVYVSTK